MTPQIQGLNIVGYTEGLFGLGEAVRLNVEAAKTVGIPVNVIDYEKIKRNNKYKYDFTYSVNLVQISLRDVETFFAIIDPNIFKGRYTILFLMWESEYMPPILAENLNLFNEIWTASSYCNGIFKKVFNNPVVTIPHPVEVKLKSITNKETAKFFDQNKFSFLFVFSYHSSVERKNPFFLIDAFIKAFGTNEHVELIIKTVGAEKHKPDKQRLSKAISNAKNIKIFDINLNKNNVNHLINDCDCYVSMHHSEGFGLTLAEAMSLGKPTIATNYSGNTEFMTDDNSYLVDFELASINNSDANFCSNTVWANPIMADAVEKLKQIYDNSVLRIEKATNAHFFVKDKLSFFSVGSIMKERLSILYNNFDELVINQSQNAYFINQLQLAKIETAKLQREIRRMKKNILIRFILFLKEAIRKLKNKS